MFFLFETFNVVFNSTSWYYIAYEYMDAAGLLNVIKT